MEFELKLLCDEFIKNRDTIVSSFVLKGYEITAASAMIFINNEITAKKDKLNEMNSLLKNHASLFSNFRGICTVPVVSMLAASTNPNLTIKKLIEIKELINNRFFNDNYSIISSFILLELVEEEKYLEVLDRAKYLYDEIKRTHAFLTNREDVLYCILLATSNKTNDVILAEVEQYYQLLKKNFVSNNAVQSLSHILTLEESDINDECNKLLNFYNKLKQHGYKYGTTFELPTLALLSKVNVDIDVLLKDFSSVEQFLKKQKGYGFFGLCSKVRYLHTAMLLLKHYTKDSNDNTIFINLTLSHIILKYMMASSAAYGSAFI